MCKKSYEIFGGDRAIHLGSVLRKPWGMHPPPPPPRHLRVKNILSALFFYVLLLAYQNNIYANIMESPIVWCDLHKWCTCTLLLTAISSYTTFSITYFDITDHATICWILLHHSTLRHSHFLQHTRWFIIYSFK